MGWSQQKLTGQWKRLQLQYGILFQCLQDTRDGEEVHQLVVPESLQWVIYEIQHDHRGHSVRVIQWRL